MHMLLLVIAGVYIRFCRFPSLELWVSLFVRILSHVNLNVSFYAAALKIKLCLP